MKSITINGIESVLDKALLDYKSGKYRNKNILFVGHAGIGRSSKIKEWCSKHADDLTLFNLTESVVCEEINGSYSAIVEGGHKIYGFSGWDMDQLVADGAAFCANINYKEQEQIQPYFEIFEKRSYNDRVTNHEYDLSKLFLLIATAYPENFGYRTEDISEIEKCSDIYMVVPDVAEFKDFFTQREISSIHENIEEEQKFRDFKAFLESDFFHFVFEKDEFFSPCTFMMLYNLCDTSSKGEVLSNLPGKTTLEMFKHIFEHENP